MANNASFEEVKAAVPITAVINHYLQEGNQEPINDPPEQLRMPCFICDYDNPTCFSANTAKNIYKCFHCGSAGNIINLVMDAEQVKDWEACRLIAQRHSVTSQRGPRLTSGAKAAANTPPEAEAPASKHKAVQSDATEKEVSIASNTPLRFELKHIDHEHSSRELLELSAETLDHFNVGFYSGRGHFKDLLIMPIRNIAGTLIAYCSLDPESGEVGYPPEKNFNRGYDLFNANAALELESPGGVLSLAHSPLAVLQRYNEGERDILSFFSDEPTVTQINLLKIILTKNQYNNVVFHGSGESDSAVGRVVRALDQVYVRWVD